MILAILTPFGVLAVGSAWGEWSAGDFLHPETRRQIAATSGGHELPAQVPAGLQRLARLWTAPLSYASQIPAAIAGMLLIIGTCWCIVMLARRIGVRRNMSFIDYRFLHSRGVRCYRPERTQQPLVFVVQVTTLVTTLLTDE